MIALKTYKRTIIYILYSTVIFNNTAVVARLVHHVDAAKLPPRNAE